MSEYRELANRIITLDTKLLYTEDLKLRSDILRELSDVARRLHVTADKERDALYRRLDSEVTDK